MKKLFLLLLLFPFLLGCSQKEKEFTVLQWNIWQEGTVIPGGYDAIVNEIARLRPDFVTLSEVRNYENTKFHCPPSAIIKGKRRNLLFLLYL